MRAKIIIELIYELDEEGYPLEDESITHDPDKMIKEDIKAIDNLGLEEWLECTDNNCIKVSGYSYEITK